MIIGRIGTGFAAGVTVPGFAVTAGGDARATDPPQAIPVETRSTDKVRDDLFKKVILEHTPWAELFVI